MISCGRSSWPRTWPPCYWKLSTTMSEAEHLLCPQVAMAQLQSQQLAAQVAAIRAQARLQQPSGASAGLPLYSAPQNAFRKHML